ncbi:acyl-protein thioesterase 1 isoform X2 [Brassica rapa]|uniref:acyl-protein thioesterase 1 isoform X2 n=1 Tax=Brassica campestris TaxID=3711 RepID=UPI0004F16EFD|nr:acyl-protein thioesterase 1 isoform X2 [Brassica rapa]
MSYSHQSMGSGSRNARGYEFGRTYVVRPKGKHQATLVWLHGLGDNGSSSSQLMESLHLPNIKWICPTAPTRPVSSLGGFTCTAWFDVGEISEDGHDDMESLDASASHIANLLCSEPADVKVGIGGFSMGAAISLYSATCYALGRYGTGHSYPINLRAVVGLSGWLPGWKSIRNKIESSYEAARRASSLPVILTHGIGLERNLRSLLAWLDFGKPCLSRTKDLVTILFPKKWMRSFTGSQRGSVSRAHAK